MKLIKRKDQEPVNCEIKPIASTDFKILKKGNQFSFDWELEKEYDIYKFVLEEKVIIGVVALLDIPEELRINIDLIEVAVDFRDKEKRIEGVAGCLIAFACRLAFEKGYGGFVSLTPKTKLINYYQEKYGFRQFGRQLAVLGPISENLIQQYLQ